MKVIFLDIDGVLNSSRTCEAFGNYPHSFSAGQMRFFDKVTINLLRKFCKKHGVSVVISSVWRKSFPPKEFARALKLPVIGATVSHLSDSERGYEIQDWLDKHPEVKEYAILDDDSDMLEKQKPRLIQTCRNNGFRWEDYKQLEKLLGGAQCRQDTPQI